MRLLSLALSFALTSCATFDVDALKRVVKDKKIQLIEVDKDTSVVLRRDRDCHCAMIRYELKF